MLHLKEGQLEIYCFALFGTEIINYSIKSAAHYLNISLPLHYRVLTTNKGKRIQKYLKLIFCFTSTTIVLNTFLNAHII